MTKSRSFRPSVAVFTLLYCVASFTTYLIVDSSIRGLDLTDEGMYLLSATTTNRHAAFHNPFADYTSLLLSFSFQKVWLFRILGLVLLSTTGFILGFRTSELLSPSTQFSRHLFGLVGLTIPFSYYATGLITPSYNWLNVLALTLGGIACVELLHRQQLEWSDAWLVGVVGALAIWLGLFAKATTAPGILVLLISTLVVSKSKVMSWIRLICTGICTTLCMLVVHILFIESVSITLDKLRRGHEILVLLDPGYSLQRTLDNFFWGLKEWCRRSFILHTGSTVLMICAAVFAVVIRILRATGRNAYGRTTFTILSTLALLMSMLMSFRAGLWAGYSEKYINQMWAASGLLAIGILVAGFRVLLGSPALNFQGWWCATLCVVLAILYAIGSGNGFIAQLTGAVGFLNLAAMILCGEADFHRTIARPVLAACVLLGALFVTQQATIHPYRQPPRSLQTTSLYLEGGHGSVYVDDDFAEMVTELRRDLADSGWRSGSPLLDLTSYSAGLVFLLGGKSPLTIIPTVGLYPSVDAVARWSLNKTLQDDMTWRNAWILLPTNAETEAPLGRPNPSILEEIGRTFPTDYVQAAEAGGYTIWKPIEP
jgi:hypothetical protein